MAATGPTTGFKVTDPDTLVVQDLGDRYVSKDYLLDKYPSIAPARRVPALYSWGRNDFGQLGLGDIVHRSSPIQIGSLKNWNTIHSYNSHMLIALKTDGSLWTCGYSTISRPMTGDGTTTNRSSPVQVGSLNNWADLGTQATCVIGLKTDGTIWSWGTNIQGQLGHGDKTNRSTPVQIGTLSTWASVAKGGTYAAGAIKTDGTLWMWGENFNGALGNGTTVNTSSPIQIGVLTDWRQIACGYRFTTALKTDGTIWGWGGNQYGQLGLGDVVHRSSPVQIGSATDWKYIIGGTFFVLALKNNGTLWGWGGNQHGQLGLGDVVHRSSPVQIGALTNWKILGTGDSHGIAIKTDGTLWTWGLNNYGQLGLDDQTNRSSPTQVGDFSTWKGLSGGVLQTYAINDGYI